MPKRRFAQAVPCVIAGLVTSGTATVYYAQPSIAYPPNCLVVDYDQCALEAAKAPLSLCAELADLVGPVLSLAINLPSHVPLEQTRDDLRAASCLLDASGRLTLLMPSRSGHSAVGRMLEECFESVRRCTGKTISFDCAGPKRIGTQVPNRIVTYQDPVSDSELELWTRPGIFSAEHVDPGSALLLEAIGQPSGKTLVDVGCGYGVLGIVAAKRGAKVTMVDCDVRAVKLARENLQRNALQGQVLLANTLVGLANGSTDMAISNPPTHAGSGQIIDILREMARVCHEGSQLLIVVREHLQYESWLACLGNVQRLLQRDGYKVLGVNYT